MSTRVPKVLVLLSTHNGEKYLDELLQSLLRQEDIHIKILVRDDGSTDRTLQILEKYSAQIMLLEMDRINIGPDASFKVLIKESAIIDYDYLAFCDQDDIWMSDKVARAIQKMKESQKSHYSSKRFQFSGHVGTASLFPKKDRIQVFEESVFDNISAGCTIVIEREHFLRLQTLNIFDIDGSYDHIISLSSIALGENYFDQESRIFYRIHENNAVGLPRLRNRTLSQTTSQILHKLYLLEQVWKKLGDNMNERDALFCSNFYKCQPFRSRIFWILSLPKLRQVFYEDVFLKMYLLVHGSRRN